MLHIILHFDCNVEMNKKTTVVDFLKRKSV